MNAASSKVLAGFSQPRNAPVCGGHWRGSMKFARNGSIVMKMRTVAAWVAQDVRHPPVDGLHSIDFQDDKTPAFLLTLKMKGVKTTSFFDSF
ncbi:MAG TPA: hypothetical protein VEU11_07380 [Terriglobales bacterium]|jgi:hypothetical protein|nr:hypothetical protein [Terriglobales bacterium]